MPEAINEQLHQRSPLGQGPREGIWTHLEMISRDWPGEVSKTGLIHFLSKGVRALDVNKSPGGFTAFMFSAVDMKQIYR
jgi:hypothetical protein